MAKKLYKLKIRSLLFLSVATLIFLQCKTQSITSEHIIPVTSKEVIAKGEKLFRTNCNACHLPNQQVIGPPLIGLVEKRNKKWLIAYIYDSKSIKMAGDKDALEVQRKSEFHNEHLFKELSEQEIVSIFSFVESKK